MSGEGKLVCVTGASGFIASWLVKLLLLRGYTVNATVRDPSDRKKVEHLFAFEGAKERLHLFKAELIEDCSFDGAISGCDGVFHIASPVFLDADDPQAEILDPTIKGALNVLNSCAKFPSVKRLVLTSSMAALVNNDKPITPDDVIDESWFSDPEYCRQEKLWYPLAKILTEETAQKYTKNKGFDVVFMNPGYVIGPSLQPKLSQSCVAFVNLIKAKSYSNITYPSVHVKDVANAHIIALETLSANGRYTLVESATTAVETLRILRELYPTLQLPEQCEDDKPPRQIFQISNEKAKSLGINFIPFGISLKEMIDNLHEKNIISF